MSGNTSTKPRVILDPHWRTVEELFSSESLAELNHRYDVVWGKNEPIPDSVFDDAIQDASVLIAATPVVTLETLKAAPALTTVIEVSGAFPDSIDYHACKDRGVEVLSCAPGFRNAVAEMGLGMAISCARGVITEHEAFRHGGERWLEDNARTDFTLFGASIGFIGFGQIAQELTRLLAPFKAKIVAYDPWLPEDVAESMNVTLRNFEDVLDHSRCLFITASPTTENKGLLSKEALSSLADNSLVVVLSRAHLVDFDAVAAEALSGRLRIATDVFPSEPLAENHPLRTAGNVLLSPHRAAAVQGGRQSIGRMIVDDLNAIFATQQTRRLAVANLSTVQALAGVGDATEVADMASARET